MVRNRHGYMITDKETVMIGTLYSGEGDFDECCKAVKAQTQPHEHIVIEGLPTVKAFHELYRRFKESDHKYLFQVDADMVLNTPSTLEGVIYVAELYMNDAQKVTHQVDDFFTGRSIWGIHLYRNDMDWNWDAFQESTVCPDRLEKPLTGQRYVLEKSLAKHCWHCNAKQAFHFGASKFLKHAINSYCWQVIGNWSIREQRGFHDNGMLKQACIGMLAASEMGQEDALLLTYEENFQEMFDRHQSMMEMSDKEVQDETMKVLRASPHFKACSMPIGSVVWPMY